MNKTIDYSPKEEKLNVISHAIGLALSVLGLLLLVFRAVVHGGIWHIISFGVFGLSLVLLYAASTFYHNAKDSKLRIKLKILDHAAIYVLIAGTYTPFTLVTLSGRVAWTVFIATWAFALMGIILKFFFAGRYKLFSTLMYVFMGSIILFFIESLIEKLPWQGIQWLFAGGISYTIGAVFYSIKKIKYNHAIFHVFVLIGSSCHFASIFFYVLPV